MALIDCDVMFAPNYFLPRLLGAIARRRVITIHDLTYKRFPELLQKETLHSLEAHMMREIALADGIICVSESTRDDLLKYYEVDPSRVFAIHSGVAATTDNRQPTTALPKRYILFVSTIEPRKNLGVLLDAFENLKRRGKYDGSLVVVGRIGWKSEEFVSRLRGRDVHHLDYLSPAELQEVYRKAEMFVFPSIYEGFGFPLLEAMAHGVPTIAAESSSLPEIAGDAALYFDPRDAAQLESAISRVVENHELRHALIMRGRERVEHFRWDTAAERTVEVLERAGCA
jgi:glycosyltransferase involved in cell wall biosynthesis